MFLDGPVNDGGWGASCYGAMVESAKQHGWETAYSESVAQADWVSTMQNYVDQGYDLIVAPGNQYTADILTKSEEVRTGAVEVAIDIFDRYPAPFRPS